MILKRLPPILLFTLLLMAWTGYLYTVLLVLRLTGQMLPLPLLQRLVFGPALMLIAGFAVAISIRPR